VEQDEDAGQIHGVCGSNHRAAQPPGEGGRFCIVSGKRGRSARANDATIQEPPPRAGEKRHKLYQLNRLVGGAESLRGGTSSPTGTVGAALRLRRRSGPRFGNVVRRGRPWSGKTFGLEDSAHPTKGRTASSLPRRSSPPTRRARRSANSP